VSNSDPFAQRPSLDGLVVRDPALGIFTDPDECALPTLKSISWLGRRGVTLEAITSPWCIRAAFVIFDPQAPRYVPSPTGSAAFLFAVISGVGILDAAAWSPTLGRIGTRLGLGAALGEAQAWRDGIGTTGSPLPVWRDPIGWLKAGRRGVVICDPILAAHRFAGLILAAEDAAHVVALRQLLLVDQPTIIQSREMPNAAAA
jgi:hypothetical protein